MDPTTTMDMDQMMTGIDLPMDNDPWVEGNLPMASRHDYFSYGLLQSWHETSFDSVVPEIPLQYSTNLNTTPQTYQFNDALLPTTSYDPPLNTFNDAIAELDIMKFLTAYNSTSTEGATLSPEYLWLGGSLTTESSASSVCGVPFAQLDDSCLSGTSLSPAPLADLQNYPRPGNSSNDQVALISKKTRSRPCDLRFVGPPLSVESDIDMVAGDRERRTKGLRFASPVPNASASDVIWSDISSPSTSTKLRLWGCLWKDSDASTRLVQKLSAGKTISQDT